MRRLLALIALVCALASPQSLCSEPGENQKRMPEQMVIVPFGEVDGRVVSALAETLKDDLELSCTVAKSLAIPSAAYNAARRQYLSTRLLEEMQRHLGDEGVRLLGVVDKDLYVPELNFVFGEADIQGRAAVISLIRLRQEYYRLPADEGIFRRRVTTEAVHELGHTYGLRHCSDPRCVMFFSNSLVDTDRKGYTFCPRCKAMLLESRRLERESSGSRKPGKRT